MEGQNTCWSQCSRFAFISKSKHYHCRSSYGQWKFHEAFGKWNEIEVKTMDFPSACSFSSHFPILNWNCLNCFRIEMVVLLIGYGLYRQCHHLLYQFSIKKWLCITWNHHSIIKNQRTKFMYGKRIVTNPNHENHTENSILNKLPGNLTMHQTKNLQFGIFDFIYMNFHEFTSK